MTTMIEILLFPIAHCVLKDLILDQLATSGSQKMLPPNICVLKFCSSVNILIVAEFLKYFFYISCQCKLFQATGGSTVTH